MPYLNELITDWFRMMRTNPKQAQALINGNITLELKFSELSSRYKNLYNIWETDDIVYLKNRVKIFFVVDTLQQIKDSLPEDELQKAIEIAEKTPKSIKDAFPLLFNNLQGFRRFTEWVGINQRRSTGSKNLTVFLKEHDYLIEEFVKNGRDKIDVIDAFRDEEIETADRKVGVRVTPNGFNLVTLPIYTEQAKFYARLRERGNTGLQLKAQKLLRIPNPIQRVIIAEEKEFLREHPEIITEMTRFANGKRGPFKFRLPVKFNKGRFMSMVYQKVARQI